MIIDDIALTLQSGLGPKGVVHLLSVFGSAEAVFAADSSELTARAALRSDMAEALPAKRFHGQAERELKYMERSGIRAVASTDEAYPRMLLECDDYPHVLYYMGDVDALGGSCVSMVGTRNNSEYGTRMSNVLVGQMSELKNDIVIVSGLAFGIDVACHRAALEYGLRTVAVIANPLPQVTPAQHRRVADEILAHGGAVITELHSQSKQNGNLFLSRNRIIAGMSEGTVVVESALTGGSLSTAELANGYQRAVMAVPGRVDDRRSAGTNMLIRTRRASMVCSGGDVLYELGWSDDRMVEPHRRTEETVTLTAREQRIADAVRAGETVALEVVAQRSGLTVGDASALLLELELAGVVRALPGKRFERTE